MLSDNGIKERCKSSPEPIKSGSSLTKSGGTSKGGKLGIGRANTLLRLARTMQLCTYSLSQYQVHASKTVFDYGMTGGGGGGVERGGRKGGWGILERNFGLTGSFV